MGFLDWLDKIMDKLTGTKEEDYLTDEEQEEVNKSFNKIKGVKLGAH